jgi:hypothetical protein
MAASTGRRSAVAAGGGSAEFFPQAGKMRSAFGGKAVNWMPVASADQPIAVVLDLVRPVRPGGRLCCEGRDAGIDEAVGAELAIVRALPGQPQALCQRPGGFR